MYPSIVRAEAQISSWFLPRLPPPPEIEIQNFEVKLQDHI